MKLKIKMCYKKIMVEVKKGSTSGSMYFIRNKKHLIRAIKLIKKALLEDETNGNKKR